MPPRRPSWKRRTAASPAPASRPAGLSACLLIPALALGPPACSAPGQRADLGSVDPIERSLGVGRTLHAADQREPSRDELAELIEMLDSADPAQRLLAIRALERLTGRTRGYEHWAPRVERDAAVRRWVEWLDASASPIGQPAPATSGSGSSESSPR